MRKIGRQSFYFNFIHGADKDTSGFYSFGFSGEYQGNDSGNLFLQVNLAEIDVQEFATNAILLVIMNEYRMDGI